MKAAERKGLPVSYEFGDFRLDTLDRLLFRNGDEVHLTPKAVDILLVLLRNHGHVVEKDVLMHEVWPDTIVEENNLTRTISTLRKTIDGDLEEGFIETIPKRGYRFIGEVKESGKEYPGENTGSGPEIIGNLPEPVAPVRQGFFSGFNRSLLLILMLLVAGLAIYATWRQTGPAADNNLFSALRISPVSVTESPDESTISPDGKYIAFSSRDESGLNRIILRHVDSDTSIQILPPVDGSIQGLRFSSGGDHIYFTYRKDGETGILNRVAMTGNAPPSRIISLGEGGPASVSPDGRQIAYVRMNEKDGIGSLVLAEIDGGLEREILRHNSPDHVTPISAPAWSQDGRSVACVTGSDAPDDRLKAVILDAKSAKIAGEYPLPWASVEQVEWMGARGLIFLADETNNELRNQLWFLSIPNGDLSRITHDLNDYSDFGITGDLGSIATVQSNVISDIWLVPVQESGLIRKASSYKDRREGYHGLDWTPDGRIVFSAFDKGAEHLWIMNPDGTRRSRLTDRFISESNQHFPRVSPDGSQIVYVCEQRGRTTIWRMSINGDNLKQLTEGPHDLDPQFSFDGEWVIFTRLQSGKMTIWKAPATGGEARQISEHETHSPALAPDKRLIACAWALAGVPDRLAVIDIDGVQAPRVFEIPFPVQPSLVRWMPDGSAISFNRTSNGIANIWRLNLNGERPVQITDLSFDNIASFAWSRDGKRLAIARAHELKELVIISGLN
ncbi:MAG: winged helix-turn-helix domain-containing protein [Blastocatellales bacterium]